MLSVYPAIRFAQCVGPIHIYYNDAVIVILKCDVFLINVCRQLFYYRVKMLNVNIIIYCKRNVLLTVTYARVYVTRATTICGDNSLVIIYTAAAVNEIKRVHVQYCFLNEKKINNVLSFYSCFK